jgi:hypothetical protein
MSINSCSINSYTINSLKCRRAINVIPQDINGKSHPYHSRIDYSREEENTIDYSQLEGPYIKLTINMNNEIIEQTYENNISQVIPMITINNLDIKDTLNINIDNLNLKKKL